LEEEPSQTWTEAAKKDDPLLTKKAEVSAASPAPANEPRE
jgi:hypothetical protein